VIRQSLSDEQLMSELTEGRERLLSDTASQKLLSTLRRRLQSITQNIYILNWIPEQGEDLYDVLVDGVTVVHVEIPHTAQGSDEVFEQCSVEDYLKSKKSLTRPDRRRLELALRLARAQSAELS
jgi:hypothetical protein